MCMLGVDEVVHLSLGNKMGSGTGVAFWEEFGERGAGSIQILELDFFNDISYFRGY